MGHITWILIRRQRSKISLRPLTVLHRCERRTWKKRSHSRRAACLQSAEGFRALTSIDALSQISLVSNGDHMCAIPLWPVSAQRRDAPPTSVRY